MSKKIIINGTNLWQSHSGVQRYAIECLKEVDRLNFNHELDIEVVYPHRMKINCPEFQTIKVKPLIGLTRYYYKYTLPIYTKLSKAVFVGMMNDAPKGDVNVICLHDLIMIKPEADFSKEMIDKTLALYSEIASKCKYIVTVSDYSKNDIVEHLGVSEESVVVIPCAWQHINNMDSSDDVLEKYDALQRGNYYYAIGNYGYPHKNFKWIMETAKCNPDCIFAVAGNMPESDSGDELKPENVLYLGRVTDEENKCLMKYCKAFIHPAFLEGFGIPPMEALSLGRPIIISNASVLPEIYGGAAHYIDPYKYDYDLDLLLSENVEKPETVLNKFSWEMSGWRWYELLKKI